MTGTQEPVVPSLAVQVSAVLTNPVGLHARPSVKLTKLAKGYACRVDVALAADGPWVDAKSPVKIMRVRAPQGSTLHIRTEGADAEAAASAVLALVAGGFGEENGDG